MMIEFKGIQSNGEILISVVDYSRGDPKEFTFRDIEPEESVDQYFDRIMNKYWYLTGKNLRRYYEE